MPSIGRGFFLLKDTPVFSLPNGNRFQVITRYLLLLIVFDSIQIGTASFFFSLQVLLRMLIQYLPNISNLLMVIGKDNCIIVFKVNRCCAQKKNEDINIEAV